MKQVIQIGRNAGKSIVMEQVMAERIKGHYTIEQFLQQQLVASDRGPEHDEMWMTERLQKWWPGPYRVEKVIDYQWQSVEYKIVFNTPEEETWFRLQN